MALDDLRQVGDGECPLFGVGRLQKRLDVRLQLGPELRAPQTLRNPTGDRWSAGGPGRAFPGLPALREGGIEPRAEG